MSRQSTIQRVPSLPALRGGLANHDADVKMLHGHLEMMTTLLNQAVQSLENRVNTIQQVGAVQPLFDVRPPPDALSVYDVSRDGRFLVTTLEQQTAVVTPLTLVVNWPALLAK